jgi:predicted Rossmann fold nucleotide-binding protein DprA/Smf involved in DNA uptake
MDELCTRTGLPVTQCMSTVTTLELRGVIECALTGEIRRF